jgi:non-ribosomal peptide synthetase component F/NRPS condensation-like uncharacterized protein
MLAFERLHPGTGVFHLCFAARHTGHVDEDRLDSALSALIRRHPALGSTFADGDDGPVRHVHDPAMTASWTDLRHLPQAERLAVAGRVAERTAGEPFDLSRGPLARVHGCRLADDERLLIFAAHHLVCDGGSLRVLLAELDAAYRGELAGLVPEVTSPPAGEAALAYWRGQLAGLPELRLPADHGRPAQPAFRAGSVPLTVPEELVAAAAALARAENATLFMVVLAAFQLLLGELSGQDDFAVGSPEAGRARPGQHGVVGLLASPLVLRADLSGRPCFRDLVRRAQATCLAAFAHRGAAFDELARAIAPGRRADGALVQASLVFHGERGEPTLAGAPLEPVTVTRPGLNYGVDLHLWRERGRLSGTWDYSAEEFEPPTAARMAERLPVLLRRALAEPDRPVDQLELLTDDERTLLRRADGALLHVRRTPDGDADRLDRPAGGAVAGPAGGRPQGPDEEFVAAVWRQVLELDEVGRDDDFFDLGGDSLLASQVLSKLHERVGAGFPLRLVFEHSRLADLAAALPAPAAALARGRPAVTPRPPGAEPVLSFDQQRVWLECQVKPSVAYNVHGRQRLRGALDIDVLERSIRAIISRHETLRTTFPLVQWRPVQHVAEPDPSWRLTVKDLSVLGPDAVKAAERLADDQAAASFDLAAGPLFDCVLVRLGEDDHLLSITIHHIVADGWSFGLVLHELSALYRAGGDLERAGLPALSVQYRDYAVWQRNALAGDWLAGQVSYWRDQLAGAPPAVTLPTAGRRSPAQGAVGGRVRAALGADDSAALYRLCREHEVTPFMTMLAALATVLRRWSGQDDLVIGVPVNTRRATGTDALIGFFVNTIPIRIQLSGPPTFGELLGRVRQASLDGYVNHGETPFDVLVSQLRVVRDPSRTPLFQVLLNMIESAEHGWQLPGISVQMAEQPVQPSKFDLSLDVHQGGGVFGFDLLYHADRYDARAMQAFLDQLREVLVAAAADPGRGILEYELERMPGGGTAGPAASPAPLLAIDRQAGQRPDAVAVIDRHGSWSYRELACAAARVACLVAQRGPDPAGGCEAEVVRRPTAGFAAAVLGCIRAAVPYRVIDPDDTPAASTVLDPDPDADAPGGGVDVRGLLRPVTAEAPAHGTGLPPAGTTDWAADRFDLSSADRFAVLPGPPGMLMSALCTAAAVGGTLVLADDHGAGDPGRLVTWLRRTSITAMYLAPPLLRSWPAREPVLPLLRYAFLDNSGDLTAQDVERVRQLAPGCRVVSVYRPAGTGQPIAAYAVPAAWSSRTAPLRVPIGSAVAGPAVLLSPAGRPAATGEVAELSFHGRPTGDLVRRRPDQLLEFAGPAAAGGLSGAPHADVLETTAALRDVPGVLDAVVTERRNPDGGTALAAYVASPGQAVHLGRLRQHLVTCLPEYLVPRHVVVLDRLPLTARCDYDLAALPDPADDTTPVDRSAATAPAR